MQIKSLAIPEVKLITPKKFGDHRGFFSETYKKSAFEEAGLHFDFMQDNHSYSAGTGVLRGLHYQSPPFAQTKLVRVTRGRIFDVAVDIRVDSPTYGRWVGAELSADNWAQLLMPRGFAHGFMTLVADTEVLYKVDAPYAPHNDHGVLWSDPQIAVDWPQISGAPILSDKDAVQPLLSSIYSPFRYEG